MGSPDDKRAINGHWWGNGNTDTADFKTHAVFVRLPVVPPSSMYTSCADALRANGNAADGVYSLKTSGSGSLYSNYCDQTTLGGGWTLVAKVQGQSAMMNKANTKQWRDALPMGNVLDLSDENALSSGAYTSVQFTDIMIRSITDPSKHVAWRHPSEKQNLFDVVRACSPVSDGQLLSGGVESLDYTGAASKHKMCDDVKYGLFGYDYTYDEGPVAGCDVSHTGHAGGVFSVSVFDTAHRSNAGKQMGCMSDWSVGGGYHSMGSPDDKRAINGHWWGNGNTDTADFKTHAVFVRVPVE